MKEKVRFFSILTSLSGILFFISSLSTFFAIRYGSESLNALFNFQPTKVIGQTKERRFESDWANPNGYGFFVEDKIISRKAACEGMTLLWNEESALPLKEKSRISLFGHSSVDIVECGTGSGHIDTISQDGKRYHDTSKESLGRYFEINENLYDFYESKEGAYYVRQELAYSESGPGRINEVPFEKYSQDVLSSLNEYSDAALIFISRTGGENGDLYESEENDKEDGGYLSLTKEEKDLLSHVTNDFSFKKKFLF